MELTEHAASQPLISSQPHNSSRQSGRSLGFGFRINDRQAAIIAAVYTICASIATFFGYFFLIISTSSQKHHLSDVYWGVQASYGGAIIAEITSLCLSVALLIAIHQENSSPIVPWVLGYIGSIALEALTIVYSNVLRDHVNQGFDQLCHFEVGIFLSKTLLNIVAIGYVVRFYRQLKNGATWKILDVYEL